MVFGTVAFAQETDTEIPAEQIEMTMEAEVSEDEKIEKSLYNDWKFFHIRKFCCKMR